MSDSGSRARRAVVRLVAILAGLAVLSAGCGDSDDDTSGASTADALVGLWVSNGGVYVDFATDGSYSAAFTRTALVENPMESGQWSVEGSELTWAASSSSSPGCEGTSGRYDVEVSADDQRRAQFTIIGDDPCVNRARDLRAGPLLAR